MLWTGNTLFIRYFPSICCVQRHQFNAAALSIRYFDEPFHSWEWSMSNFSCSSPRNITSHSKENLAFHSLLKWKMIIMQILATSLMYLLFKRLGECTFWAQEWKGKPFHSQEWSISNSPCSLITRETYLTQYELGFSYVSHVYNVYNVMFIYIALMFILPCIYYVFTTSLIHSSLKGLDIHLIR